MAAKSTKSFVKASSKHVRPLLSLDIKEARLRALGLYRAWFRYFPYLMQYSDIPKTEQDCQRKLREKFYKHAKVNDPRVVDMLVMKGYMELKEVSNNWMQKSRILAYWNPTIQPKPNDFLSKFMDGRD